jgi:hypothetical protein
MTFAHEPPRKRRAPRRTRIIAQITRIDAPSAQRRRGSAYPRQHETQAGKHITALGRRARSVTHHGSRHRHASTSARPARRSRRLPHAARDLYSGARSVASAMTRHRDRSAAGSALFDGPLAPSGSPMTRSRSYRVAQTPCPQTIRSSGPWDRRSDCCLKAFSSRCFGVRLRDMQHDRGADRT